MSFDIYNGETLLADRVTVATRREDRIRGLIGRYHFDPGEALWILPCEAIHTFGLPFPIDVAFLDSMGTVLASATVQPGGNFQASGAKCCVEFPAGTLADTQPGDVLAFVQH